MIITLIRQHQNKANVPNVEIELNIEEFDQILVSLDRQAAFIINLQKENVNYISNSSSRVLREESKKHLDLKYKLIDFLNK